MPGAARTDLPTAGSFQTATTASSPTISDPGSRQLLASDERVGRGATRTLCDLLPWSNRRRKPRTGARSCHGRVRGEPAALQR